MSKVKFNEDIMKRLGKHRYVKEINEKQIKFTDEFKSIIVREYEAGKRARQIMEEAQIQMLQLVIHPAAQVPYQVPGSFMRQIIA